MGDDNVIEQYKHLAGAVIKHIDILSDDDSGSKEYGAYKIFIATNEGELIFSGCHDLGPDLEVVEYD